MCLQHAFFVITFVGQYTIYAYSGALTEQEVAANTSSTMNHSARIKKSFQQICSSTDHHFGKPFTNKKTIHIPAAWNLLNSEFPTKLLQNFRQYLSTKQRSPKLPT